MSLGSSSPWAGSRLSNSGPNAGSPWSHLSRRTTHRNSVASTTAAISCPWRVAIYGPFGCRGLKKLDKPLFRFLHLPHHGRLQVCPDRIHLYYLSRTWQLAGKAFLAWAVALSEGTVSTVFPAVLVSHECLWDADRGGDLAGPGSQRRASPASAIICVQASSPEARTTISHQTRFWDQPLRQVRSPVPFAHQILAPGTPPVAEFHAREPAALPETAVARGGRKWVGWVEPRTVRATGF